MDSTLWSLWVGFCTAYICKFRHVWTLGVPTHIGTLCGLAEYEFMVFCCFFTSPKEWQAKLILFWWSVKYETQNENIDWLTEFTNPSTNMTSWHLTADSQFTSCNTDVDTVLCLAPRSFTIKLKQTRQPHQKYTQNSNKTFYCH